MKEYYLRTGNRMQFPEMTDYLYRKGLLLDSPPHKLPAAEMFGTLDNEEFNKVIDDIVLTVDPGLKASFRVGENAIIPHSKDV
ncbi:MAG TPA: AraC family transcriptional regulator, partial [Candidatus Mediterraneibacter intestinavium]|nr:AraC family transcriptional regulator [Candidatus Mediterraneibacter intestinavium]